MKNKKEFETEKTIRLAEYVTLLQGARSLREMSSDTGVAASYINVIKHKKTIPSVDILKSLAKGNPQNGVTLEDLMIAAGYQENDSISQSAREYNSSERRRNSEKFTNMASSLVISSLFSKGDYKVSVDQETHRENDFRIDLCLKVEQEEINQWWFKAIYVHSEDRDSTHRVKDIISRCVFLEPVKGRKLTYIMNNETVYENLLIYKNKISYKGDLSILLVDEEMCKVVKEDYLSVYDEKASCIKEYKVI